MSRRRNPIDALVNRKFGAGAAVRIRARSRVPTNKSLNRKIKKIQRKEELKYADYAHTAVISASAGNFFLLNGVNQGTGDHEMIGEAHTSTSIQLRGHLQADSAIAGPLRSSQVVRVMVFYDRQPNGAAPTYADLFNNVFATGLELYAPYNEDNSMRFKFVYDKIKVINPQWADAAGTTQQNNIVTLKFKRKLGRKVNYSDGNPGDITGINSNALWLYVLGLSNTDPPSIFATTRYIFKDT